MKHLFRNSLIALTTACALPAAANTIALWDFNGSTLSPSVGPGTAGGIGGVSTNYFSGSPSDPAAGNMAVSFAAFPAVNSGNKTAGVQFNVSTKDYVGISVSYDIRRSPTASQYERFQYSINGIDFIDANVFSQTTANTFVTRTIDLTSVPGVENNPNFAIRIVSEFQSTATGGGAASYVGTSSGYSGSSGTWRFDMVGVFAVSPVPEPSTAMLGLVGAGALALRARRRR